MRIKSRILLTALSLALSISAVQPALASNVAYMPDVYPEMSDASFWSNLQDNPQEVILNEEEIKAFNNDSFLANGTMVMDLKNAKESFDGTSRNNAVRSSSTSDANYYFGWTYDKDGNKADWSYFEEMIENCIDPNASKNMPVRYGIAVNRTTLRVFPSENPLLDDPNDLDSDNQDLSAVPVNEPVLIYTSSADGKYYLARIFSCSGWIPAEDVAICKDKEEWLSAWDIPSENLLVVYGNKVYTENSNEYSQTSRRLLTIGTAVELVKDLAPDQLIGNRSPFHNYAVYLPVRLSDGSYEKLPALIPETAKVSVGYLPLTSENIAKVSLSTLGDTYGWGGMLDAEDCSGLVRTIYSCFGLEIGRNANWQWEMNIEKIDMTNMSSEEKCLILDELPLGSALAFPGHEMIYLGKINDEYYVISAVGTIMSPLTGNRLSTRDVMINTLDVRRANGKTWLEAINKAFMPCYAKLEGKKYDFPSLQWYHDAVAYCLKNSIMTLSDGGVFGVDEVVTRSMMADAIWALEGKPGYDKESIFSDVPHTHPSYPSITWASNAGIITGYNETTFAPKDILTREQAVSILWRYAKYKGLDVSLGQNTNTLSYNDALSISEYALPAMSWGCTSGIISGIPEKDSALLNLLPKGNLSRAQLAVMLMKFSLNAK